MISLLGVEYVDNGRDIKTDGGLDCWGLVREVYKRELKINLPEFLLTEKDLRINEFEKQSESNWEETKVIKPYAVVLFRLKDYTYHCGVVMPDKRRFIHCRKPCVMIESLDANIWKRLRVGYYEYKKTDN